MMVWDFLIQITSNWLQKSPKELVTSFVRNTFVDNQQKVVSTYWFYNHLLTMKFRNQIRWLIAVTGHMTK